MSTTLTPNPTTPGALTPPAAPTPTTVSLPLQGLLAGFRRFTVDEYHKLIEIGLLTEDDNVELINGYLVKKMSRNPPHDSTLQRLNRVLTRLVPDGWQVRVQMAVTLPNNEPEPDAAVVRGDDHTFDSRHPGPADIGLLVEVADSTLAGDRVDKGLMYAAAGIPEYWIVNLIDRVVEVYTRPTGPAAVTPGYATRTAFPAGTAVPVTLDGVTVGSVPVDGLLP